MLDTIIIGGGPAGLACAAELKDGRRDALVLERAPLVGEHLREIQGRILNWPGQALSNGAALQQTLAAWASEIGLNIQTGATIREVDLAQLRVDGVAARSILIATGVRRATLDLPSLSDVSYNPELCADHFYDQPLAIVGGGDNAVWDALKFAPRAPRIYILCRGPVLRARADWIAQLPSNVEVLSNARVVGVTVQDGRLQGVRLESGPEIAVTRLSIRIGFVPNTDLFRGQVDMTPGGSIQIAPDGATSVAGVYAAGDCASPTYMRLAAAAGQGQLAAAGILTWLRKTSAV